MRGKVVCATAWEAALCFSLPTWILAGDHAWPANDPLRFAAATVAAATVALVFFHIVPAICAPELARIKEGLPESLREVAYVWCAIGAAASALFIARGMGRDAVWRFDAELLASVAALGSMILGVLAVWAGLRVQRAIALGLGSLGLGFVAASVVAQYGGLWMRTAQLVTESRLGDDGEVFQGLLLALAPASLFAFRIGTIERSRRAIVGTGVLGIWIPAVSSVTMAAVAKMGGVRLYWKPSLPIDVSYAFAWYPSVTHATLREPVFLLMFTPLATCLMWVSDLTAGAAQPWRRALALAASTLAGFALLGDESLFKFYCVPWCWSILGGSVALAGWLVARGLASRFHPFAAPPDG